VFNNWVPMTGSTLPGWKAVGAGDIMGNGYASEVIQESDGSIVYANMTGGVFHNWLNVAATPGWNVIAVEDVLGNGYDDIVIQNTTTGDIDYADMTGGSFQHWVAVTTAAGFTGHTGPANGDPGATGAALPASMLGAGFADASGQSNGNLPSASSAADSGTQGGGAFNTNPGIPIDDRSTQPFISWDDPPMPPPDGNTTLSTPYLPSGVFEWNHYASNSPPSASDTSSNGKPGAISWHDAISSAGDNMQLTFASSAGGVADYLNEGRDNGSVAGLASTADRISASWQTEGAQNGGAPIYGAAQVPDTFGLDPNSTSIVTAANLQNLLHSGGNG
jgi:hypothetical protein